MCACASKCSTRCSCVKGQRSSIGDAVVNANAYAVIHNGIYILEGDVHYELLKLRSLLQCMHLNVHAVRACMGQRSNKYDLNLEGIIVKSTLFDLF